MLKKFIKSPAVIKDGIFTSEDINNLTFPKECQIFVNCPKCQKKGFVKIPTNLIEKCNNLLFVIIHSSIICEHTFTLYLDKDFVVRDSRVVDLEIKKK